MSIAYRPKIYLYSPTQPIGVFCLFINKKYFDHVEGTNSKYEVKQNNISANMEIKEQKLGQHEIVFDTSMSNTLQIR